MTPRGTTAIWRPHLVKFQFEILYQQYRLVEKLRPITDTEHISVVDIALIQLVLK